MSSNEQQALGAVTQADRIAAADLLDELSALLDHNGIGQVADLIRDGEYDEHEATIAFMAHRSACALTPTDQVEADGDKALAKEAAQLVAELRAAVTYQYMPMSVRQHLSSAASMIDRLSANPAPDKALMRDAAVGEELLKALFLMAHSDGWRGNQLRRDSQQIDAEKSWQMYVEHGAIAKLVARHTTPTPVEELEKGAAGDQVESLIRKFELACRTVPEATSLGRKLRAALAATNAGQVEEVARRELSNIDKVNADCPANRKRLGDKLCPTCSAGPNEGCRKEIIAMSQLVGELRTALTNRVQS